MLGFLPEGRVRKAFVAAWARSYPDDVNRIIEPFRAKLPKDVDEQSLAQSFA